MSALYIDPALALKHPEPPYREQREHLYAPVAPFAAAIREWLGMRSRELEALPFRDIGMDARDLYRRKRRQHADLNQGIGGLARRAGVDPAQIKRWLNGEAKWIELESADNLAMALDIPLCLLADEFKPKTQTLHVDGLATRRARPPKPNGLECSECGKTLVGQQTLYCSKLCMGRGRARKAAAA